VSRLDGLPGYDAWLTHDPDDDRCEFCGVGNAKCRSGWRPEECTGECRRVWRDPDEEYERRREEEYERRREEEYERRREEGRE